MWILIVGLIVLTLVAMLIGKWYYYRMNKKIEKGELEEIPPVVEVDEECCGQHEVCEKDSLLAAVSKGIEYYDDEELDRFRGRSSDNYTDAEVEEFREVMFTCQDDEVAGWCRSLQLRGIELPDELKDELFLIIGERRTGH
ncbi:MAG: phospholipase [Bacteroides sp.]|nr:phospholipase [Bacteroidaceae bacterium]MBQ8875470.1 phospholipase [Bacteroides sp.]